MLLMQMIGCTVQLCVQSYQAISALVDDDQGLLIVRLFFFAVYTTYVMLHIYLYCYVGQKLFTEGTEMAYAAYNCNWYNLSPNDAKCLTIIMSRAQISSRITAGKFCSFNHVLFSNILKTSMGYLSVLYAMKTKDMESQHAKVSYVDYICGWNRYSMKILGIWPNERKINETSSYLVLLPLSMMLLFINIPQTINLYFIWGDIDLIIENLSIGNMTVFIAILKTIIFWFSGGSIRILLTNMEKDRKETNAKNEVRRMMKIANICRRISIVCTLTYYMVIILFIILHLLLIRYIGRILIIRSYFPYNIQSTPNYELTIFAQILAACCTGGVYTSVDTFVATLVFHLCGQLNNLKHSLRDLYSNDCNEIKLKIAKIVKKHNSLNRFTKTIEQKFNGMLLLQMLGCSLQLCATCFQILMALAGKNGVILVQTTFLSAYLIYILLQIYLYCYIGEKLISESIGIFDAAYECKWYTLPPNEIKSLIIIMIRAKVPLHITAGKFCSFRYQLFCNILRTSMSYLSVLHAMNIVNTK
ncbi:PREDICTED: odorant receptor 13a-like [Polistes dominula]|uniref:Odorant receptor 13a-like n=1 Tax=Polistes dominula TaxID=743375 RepID=A0ABM1ILY9_POLDO|nr:PREDICTED: odorant receptor 13a-like [Polistes dominula]